MPNVLRVLIIEDRPDDAELVIHELERDGHQVLAQIVDNRHDLLSHLTPDIDVILADYNLPQFNALDALALIKEQGLDIPFLVVTGALGDEAAVECLKQGAADFLLKDRLARLNQAVAHAIHEKALRTEKRLAEEALHVSEARYRRLAENAPDVIFRYRFSPTPGYEYVSPAVIELIGYSPADFYADPELALKLVHPDDRLMVEQSAHYNNRPILPLVLRWLAKDNRVVWMEQRTIPILDDAGTLLAIEGIARDITERKEAEEILRKSETRFRLLFEESPIGIAILRSGIVLYTHLTQG
ncbi:MAG: PAS domain-containing protein [Aggregatilineales bacterium]